MVAWVVNSRHPSRRSALSISSLTLRPAPAHSSPILPLLCFQSLMNCKFCISFVLTFIRNARGVGGCASSRLGCSDLRRSNVQRFLDLSPFFSNSCALFCTYENVNSFIFRRFRTLSQKHPGWGVSPLAFPFIHYPRTTDYESHSAGCPPSSQMLRFGVP